MLTPQQKQQLQNNWNKRDHPDCKGEVRIYDPLSPWECYLIALNPENDDEVYCIIKGFSVQIMTWYMKSIENMFNNAGEPPKVDHEYRPIEAQEIYKKLIMRF